MCMAGSRMLTTRSLLCISVLSILTLLLHPCHGLRGAIGAPSAQARRPLQPRSGHLNPLTRAVVDDTGAGFGHPSSLRLSFRGDDDELQGAYFRFLLGDVAAAVAGEKRKRRSSSSDQFVPDYYEFMMGHDERLKEMKRYQDGSAKPDYWDFITGNAFRKKAEAAETRHDVIRRKTAADGDGLRDVQEIKMDFRHGSA